MNAIILCAFDHGTSAKAKNARKEREKREERIFLFASFASFADPMLFEGVRA